MEIEYRKDKNGDEVAVFMERNEDSIFVHHTSKLYCCYKNSPYNDKRAIIFERPEFNRTDVQVYSDRQVNWYDNYHEVFNKYFTKGQYFSSYKPSLIEQFLCELTGSPIMLTGIVEEVNMSDGYPYWAFFYKDEKRLKEQGLLEKQKEGVPKDLDKIEYSNLINRETYLDIIMKAMK